MQQSRGKLKVSNVEFKGRYTLGNKQVAASCRGDTYQRQASTCILKNFCENLCLSNRVLSLQQVTQNQIRQNLCDLLRRQNFIAETKLSLKIPPFTRSDLLLRRAVQHIT